MNTDRRSFMKLLAATPLIWLVKPKPEPEYIEIAEIYSKNPMTAKEISCLANTIPDCEPFFVALHDIPKDKFGWYKIGFTADQSENMSELDKLTIRVHQEAEAARQKQMMESNFERWVGGNWKTKKKFLAGDQWPDGLING